MQARESSVMLVPAISPQRKEKPSLEFKNRSHFVSIMMLDKIARVLVLSLQSYAEHPVMSGRSPIGRGRSQFIRTQAMCVTMDSRGPRMWIFLEGLSSSVSHSKWRWVEGRRLEKSSSLSHVTNS